MDIARGWLRECTNSHERCQQQRVVPRLPTRVIDVGDQIRVLETNGKQGQYATLSHCWGLSPPLTTKLATLAIRKTGISLEELPLTFRHAVVVARKLAIPFLWIDSLCIIQDSKQDWLTESMLMQEVYTNALLNISADEATDSTIGLIPRNRALVAGKLIHESGIYVSRKLDQIDYSRQLSHEFRNADWNQRGESILGTRAWVLQERMLSPRILHFRKYELAWECDTQIKCECSVAPRPANLRPFRMIHDVLSQSSESDEEVEIHSYRPSEFSIWGSNLHDYTNSALSHETDILSALFGLASRFAEHTSKTYIAGLWMEDFPWCLLWRPEISSSTSRRRKGNFPSWTWAALHGSVIYQPGVEVLDAAGCIELPVLALTRFPQYAVLDFENPMCRLMQVSGRLMKIRLEHNARDFAQAEDALDKHMQVYLTNEQRGSSIFSSQTYLNSDIKEENELTGGECYLLFVALGSSIYFLVLRRVLVNFDAEEQECYQRVGIFLLDKSIVDIERYLSQFEEVEIALT